MRPRRPLRPAALLREQAHDEPEAYAAGGNYFPDDMTPRHFYEPTLRGLEAKIKERLEHLRELDRKAGK